LYFIDDDQQCIFMHFSGVIDDWDLGTHAQQVWADPAFHPHFARLIDASEVSEWRAGATLLRAIASDVRIKSPRKVALVAQSEPVLAELNLYAASLADTPAQVFSNIADALVWLGVRLPESWPPEGRP
jgi:hypothetical protein